MRILFLNTWFGRAGQPFFDFIKEKSAETDIFCFMEVEPKLYTALSGVLKDFKGLYGKGHFLRGIGGLCGQATFVSKKIEVKGTENVSIYRQTDDDVGFMQLSELTVGNRNLFLGAIHGKTLPGTKRDTPVRIKQSRKIADSFKDKKGPKIFGGDFNLMPDTESIAVLENAGYRNLIKDYKIENTRNRLSWEQFKDVQHFADYCFVSPEIRVKNFEVPYVEISDHLPLILDFEI